MRIVLIQPKAYKHNPAHVHEPLNLGYLASYLRVHGYDDISVRVAALESEKDIIADASLADIVGITTTSPMMTHGLALSRQIKNINPQGTIVFGGNHPSAVPSSTLENKEVDVVVRGEGEATFVELVKAIENSSSLIEVAGISFKQDGKIVHNPDREFIKDIDSLPFPARDLMLQERFTDRWVNATGIRSAWIISSRGCPFDCTYCASKQVWKRVWRARSPENIFQEVQEITKKYKLQHVNFADDTFTVDRMRCLELCDLFQRKKSKITWACNAHVNTVDKELLREMKRAGCVEIWMGMESGSPLILKELKKGISPEQTSDAFKWSKEVGLKRHAYLMIGAPSESHETILETEKLIEEIRPDYAILTILTPYPGCALYDEAKRVGYVSDNQDWSVVDLHCTVTLPTKYLTKEQLLDEHRRFSGLLQKYKHKPKLNLTQLLTLILSKLRTSPPWEYPALVVKFTRYLASRSF